MGFRRNRRVGPRGPRAIVLGAALTLGLAACGDDGGSDVDPSLGGAAGVPCMPGATLACTCALGGQGTQQCGLDGLSLGDCSCSALPGADGGAGSTTAGGTTGATTGGTTGATSGLSTSGGSGGATTGSTTTGTSGGLTGQTGLTSGGLSGFTSGSLTGGFTTAGGLTSGGLTGMSTAGSGAGTSAGAGGDDPGATTGDDGGTSMSDAEVCPETADWDPMWAQWEDEVLMLTNEVRAAGANCDTMGMFGPAEPLAMQPQLRCAARLHSQDMGDNDYFDHTGLDGRSPFERMMAAGYSGGLMGENIAWGQRSPQQVVDGWVDSDGHCANIMNPGFTELGVGYYLVEGGGGGIFGGGGKHMWTQNFGAPRGGGNWGGWF